MKKIKSLPSCVSVNASVCLVRGGKSMKNKINQFHSSHHAVHSFSVPTHDKFSKKELRFYCFQCSDLQSETTQVVF